MERAAVVLCPCERRETGRAELGPFGTAASSVSGIAAEWVRESQAVEVVVLD